MEYEVGDKIMGWIITEIIETEFGRCYVLNCQKCGHRKPISSPKHLSHRNNCKNCIKLLHRRKK